jgi:arginyl-tRNA synthetase
MIYNQDPKIQSLWKETVGWSLEYFDQIYKRVGTHFDKLYFESECYKRGTVVTNDALKKGILEKSQGAVVFNGKKYGLDTRVFINSLGFPTYEGKELALAEKEFSDFGEIDKCIHVVTPEQTSFFKITFKVEELLDEKKYKNKQYHLIYEWVKLKDGKMSSREGNIIEGNWLIDQIKEKIQKQFKTDEETLEKIAVASAKYSFLKNSTQTVIAFDIDESISLEGNSGPYLLYTYVRCQSVLKKVQSLKLKVQNESSKFKVKISPEEKEILRQIVHFPETVNQAAVSFSPNTIATFIFELAQKYNLFYQKNPILKADVETKNFRLFLTTAVANILKKGLYLLGIETVEKM